MAKKILRINMSELKATYEGVPEEWARWAGRGLTSTIVFDEVDPTCHPLGPHNKLVIAPGWVTGSPAAPSSGRTSFGGKSPLTGGIKESNAGGLSGQQIAKLGLAAIILEGQPEKGKWYTLVITKDGVKFEDGSNLVGKGMYEVDELMWEKYPDTAVIGIGPAGEQAWHGARRRPPGQPLDLAGDEATGAMIVKRAVEEPLKQIAVNAGLEGGVVVEKVKTLDAGNGLNAATGDYVDMFATGIIDPAKVTRSALQNAASIAGLFLTTEAVIAEKPEKEKAPAAPGGGDMDF